LRIRGAADRRETETLTHEPPAPGLVDLLANISARELLTALDEELQQLPERYRLAIIHCHLEGRTVDEAARDLGTTPGTVRGWLGRGRERLASRLDARGFSLPSALLALTAEAVLVVPVVAAPSASVPPTLAAVAEAAVGSGRWSRVGWIVVGCTVIAAGVATAGVALTLSGPNSAPEVPPTAEPPVNNARELAERREERPKALPPAEPPVNPEVVRLPNGAVRLGAGSRAP